VNLVIDKRCAFRLRLHLLLAGWLPAAKSPL